MKEDPYLQRLADAIAYDLGKLAEDPTDRARGLACANNLRRLAPYLDGTSNDDRETAARSLLSQCELSSRAFV